MMTVQYKTTSRRRCTQLTDCPLTCHIRGAQITSDNLGKEENVSVNFGHTQACSGLFEVYNAE